MSWFAFETASPKRRVPAGVRLGRANPIDHDEQGDHHRRHAVARQRANDPSCLAEDFIALPMQPSGLLRNLLLFRAWRRGPVNSIPRLLGIILVISAFVSNRIAADSEMEAALRA